MSTKFHHSGNLRKSPSGRGLEERGWPDGEVRPRRNIQRDLVPLGGLIGMSLVVRFAFARFRLFKKLVESYTRLVPMSTEILHGGKENKIDSEVSVYLNFPLETGSVHSLSTVRPLSLNR